MGYHAAAWYNPLTNTDVAWNNANGDTAVFSGAADAVTVSSGMAAGEVDFTATGYTLQSGSLAISGTGTIDVGSGLTDTIGSVLNGSNGLTASDAGTLVITGINTYTGGTTVAAGTLQLGDDSALSSGSVAITTGATLDSNGTNPTVEGLSGSGTLTNSAPPATSDFDGTAIPSSTLTVGADDISSSFGGTLQDGTGGLNLTKIGAGTLTLAGTDSYSGVTTISTGTLLASSASSLSANSAFEVDGTLDLGGNNESLGSLWGTGTVQSTGASNVALTTGGDGSDALFSGVIQDGASSGSLALDATGSGVTALNDANTYSGGTTVDAGATFQLGDGMMNNGSIIGGIADSGTVQFANFTSQTFSAEISGDGGVSVSGPGVLTLEEASSFTGGTTVIAGATLQAGAANVLNPSSLADVGGTLDLNGYDQTIDGLSGESGGQVTLGSATLTIDGSDNGSTTFGGVISGTGNLHKLGTDTLVLTGANTYTGQTIIDDGAIVLGGNNHGILNSPTDGAGPVNPIDLTYDFTTVGVTSDGAGTTTGGLDGSGDTLSGDLLGASQSWNGNTFTLGAADTDNAIIASGQDIDLASVPLSQIEILATAAGGSQTAQAFTVNYTDGSSTTFMQDMSGWTSPQGYTGESVALTMAYTNEADGSANDQPVNVYGYTFAVDPTKSVASITLPDNANVVVLAVDTVSPTDTVTNLNAAPASSGTTYLSWTAPSCTVAGYNVFRGQSSGGELTLLNSSPLAATATAFDDTTVVPGNQYYYVVQAISPTNSGPSVETDLSPSFNFTGITSDGTTFSGGLDGGGEALSGTLLGSAQTWNGQSFTLGAADQPDVVKAAGQTIALSPGYYASLDLLMTATNGNQPAQTFTVNYTDGTSTAFTQGISDWYSPRAIECRKRWIANALIPLASIENTRNRRFFEEASRVIVFGRKGLSTLDCPGYSPQGYSGESVAVTMAYRNNADGTEDGRTFHVYGYQFDLDSGKAVASITLPNNGNVFLLAATAEMAGPLSNETSAATPTTGATAQADLSSAFNHAGITADGAAFTNGGLDGGGNAFSGAQLGTSQTWNGASFIIGPAGTNDAVQAAGQTVALPNGQYSQLDLLMTATNGNQADQTFTVNYSDGSSATFTQSISDWFTPQGYGGESVAVATPYRNVSNGTTDNRAFNLYGYTFDLDSSKTVVSITLPTNSNLFLFAATEHAQNILPIGSSVEINGDGLLALNGTDQTIGSLSGSGGTVSLDGATLTTGGDNTSTTYAGTITGAGNVVKTGSGIFTVTASSDYVGTTTISAGALEAAGSQVLDPNSAYIDNAILEFDSADEAIGSLAGNGTAAGSGLLTLGGDNSSTTFSGVLEDGDSGQLSLDKAGAGTFTLSGFNTSTGASQIDGGTLEIDNYILQSVVTVNMNGVLQGSGGTLQTVLNGGNAVQQLYAVSYDSQLHPGSSADTAHGTLSTNPGVNASAVLALSEMDAAFKALNGSATVDQTGVTYDLHSSAFIYRSTYQLTVNGQTSTVNQAIWLEDLTGQPGNDRDYNDDYFQLSIHLNTTNPIAKDDAYQDGVGGNLVVPAYLGLLSNDTSQSGAALFVDGVNGSTGSTRAATTAHGTLTWDSFGAFSYTPNLGFFGVDTFTYIATDGTNQSNKATVTINVVLPTITLTNVGPNPVLVSNDPVDPTSDADTGHLDQISLAVSFSNTSLSYNMAGWSLNLAASGANGSVNFWDSIGKTQELNNSGVGSETWTFGGPGLTSAAIPSSVYADMNTASTGTITAMLYSPSRNSAPVSQSAKSVQISAHSGELIAETIDDAPASADVGGSPLAEGFLEHGQTAYVPVDNEDQYYAENGNTLIPNMDQASVQNDWALLPFNVQVANPGSGAFYLNFSGGIKIFTTPSVGGEDTVISGTTEINNLLDSHGNATFYIEGITQGNVAITLTAAGQTAPLDTLNVDVFQFQGPQNVPNYSVYQYGVSGLNTAPSGATPWSIDNVTTSDQIDTENAGSAFVNWGRGLYGSAAHIGVVSFEINPNYIWSYFVNVVAIDITGPTGAPTFETGTSTMYSSSAGDFIQLVSGHPGFEATANIVMTGPRTLTSGAGRGVDQVSVGFVQTATGFNANGYYGGTGTYPLQLHSTAGNGPYPVLDAGIVNALGSVPGVEHPWYNFPIPGSANSVLLVGHSGGISMSDTPQYFLWSNYNQIYNNTNALINRTDVTFLFRLDVAAYVADPDPQVENAYTRLATVNWGYQAQGSFVTPGDAATFTGYNRVDVSSTTWTLITDGSREEVAKSPTFNGYLDPPHWYDPNNSN